MNAKTSHRYRSPIFVSTLLIAIACILAGSGEAQMSATAGVKLEYDYQAANAQAGSRPCFSHTLTNFGASNDLFSLSATNLAGDDFDFTNLDLYADGNDDGVPDISATPLGATPSLAPLEMFHFVVCGTVPAGAIDSTYGSVEVTATSTVDPTLAGTNSDDVEVTVSGVVTLTESLDTRSGLSPSGPYTYTLSYANPTSSAVRDLTLTVPIPTPLTYVPQSGQWSGSSLPLTDGNAPADPAGIAYAHDVLPTAGIAISIGQVPAGGSGAIAFQVQVNAGVFPGTPIQNGGVEYLYDGGSGEVGPFEINPVEFTVLEPPPTPTPTPTPIPTPTPTPSPTPMPTCNGKVPTHIGTAGDDVIIGGPGDDVILGLAGNDLIDGRGGNDTLCAGDGNDRVWGGRGRDWISGGAGRDVLFGGAGNDRLRGGYGADTLLGGPGHDRLWGQRGNDALNGGSGGDLCLGGWGRDTAVNCEAVGEIP